VRFACAWRTLCSIANLCPCLIVYVYVCLSSHKHRQQCHPADDLHMGHPSLITICCPVGLIW
jgi:hypothetical protein